MKSNNEEIMKFSRHTLDGGNEAAGELMERLRFATGLLKEAELANDHAYLLYRDKGQHPHACPISRELTVGREAAAQVTLAWAGRMSGRHFRVFERDGLHFAGDLGSRNGTYINGEKTTEAALCSGDVIEAGGQVFVFVTKAEL